MKQTTGDIYRHENFFTTDLEAFENAKERSLKTNKTIHVISDATGRFQTNSHGVEFQGWNTVARFKRGLKLD